MSRLSVLIIAILTLVNIAVIILFFAGVSFIAEKHILWATGFNMGYMLVEAARLLFRKDKIT